MDVIEADGLGKRYGRKWALRDCTLSVPAGCVTGLVGPNGAGKTTLISLAVGLIRPTAGTVRVAGEPAGSRAAAAWSRSWPRTPRCTSTCQCGTCCTSAGT